MTIFAYFCEKKLFSLNFCYTKCLSFFSNVWITVCIESCLPFGWRTFFKWKNLPKCCSILVWIAGCWNFLLTSRNPENNWCLSCIFGAWLSGKDHGLTTCKPWSKQEGGWIHFCMKRLRILNSYKIFKTKKNQKPTVIDVLFKAYPMVPLSCRSNIAGYCWTVPLKILSIYTIWYGLSLKTMLRYSPFIWWCRVMHMLK